MIAELLMAGPVVLVRVLVGFALGFVVLPIAVLSRPASARTPLDALVARAVRWMALALVLVHLLAVIRLFHVLPLTLIILFGVWWTRMRGGGWDTQKLAAAPTEWFAKLAEVADAIQYRGRGALSGAGALRRLRGAPRRLLNGHDPRLALTIGVPVAAVLLISLWLRVGAAFAYETLSPPEAYVWLTWAKAVAGQELYLDGLYPFGLPAFMAFLDKAVFGVDMYEMVRYSGPLITSMVILGLFYAVWRLTSNVGAAVFAAGAFGLFGNVFYWHEPWIRQTGPMPHELGLAVALFALPFAILAVTQRSRDHAYTAGAGALAIGIIHPIPLALFGALVVAGVLGAMIASRGGGAEALRTVGATLAGGALSFVWMPIGILLGRPIFRGLDNPFQGIDVDRDAFLVGAFATSAIGHTPLSLIGAGGVVAAIVAAVVLATRPRFRELAAPMLGLAFAAAVVVALYDVRWLPLPPNHLAPLGNIVGVATALALGVGFAALTAATFADRHVLRGTTAVLVLAGIGLGAFDGAFDSAPRERAPSEYEATAQVTREIMRTQEAFTYTIVGTPQQRQAVQGSGTFVDLWVFARDVSLRDARDPGFVVPDVSSLMFAADLGETLPIPTTDIYIFVEKEIFPVPEVEPTGATEEFYFNHEKRGRIMAAVYGWAEFYRYYQTDMDVHYEDENIVVYRIRRPPDVVAAAASPLFKDYTWQPGVLFEEGPTSPEEVDIPWRDE